ncbi:MAG: hypothetical protein AB7N80_08310 [Bdellovibrionales bacterium]
MRGQLHTRGLVWAALYLTLLQVLIGLVIAALIGADSRFFVLAMLFSLAFSNVFWVGAAILLRGGHVFLYSWANLIVSVGISFFPLILKDHVEHPLVFGFVVAYFFAALFILFGVLRTRWFLVRRPPNVKSLLRALKQFRAFPLFSMPVALTTILRLRLVYPLIGPVPAVGLHQQLDRLSSAPGSLLATAARPIFLSAIAKGGLMAAEQEIANTMRWTVLLYCPLIVVLTLNSTAVVKAYLGAQWLGGDYILWAVLLAGLGYSVTAWLDRGFDILGRQKTGLVLEVGYTSLLVTLIFILVQRGIESLQIVAVFSVMTFLYYLLWLGVFWRLAKFHFKSLFHVAATAGGAILITWGLCRIYGVFGLKWWVDLSAAPVASLSLWFWSSRKRSLLDVKG